MAGKGFSQEIRQPFDKGESLTSREVAERFGCSTSLLSQVIRSMEAEGYDFEVEAEGNTHRYSVAYGPEEEVEPEEEATESPKRNGKGRVNDAVSLIGQKVTVAGIMLNRKNDPEFILRDAQGSTWTATISGQADAGKR